MLKSGAHLLMAHAFAIADERGRTGFDWDTHFGAKRIAETFGDCPFIALRKELRTELYLIQLFQRIDSGDDLPLPPEIIEAEPAAPMPARVARNVIWGGAITGAWPRREHRTRVATRAIPGRGERPSVGE